MKPLYLIGFYVPIDQAESVKESMFQAGGGKIGDYSCCSFQIEGEGQFCPNPGANPFYGEVGQIETVRELKIEMVCEEDLLPEVIEALKSSHPYEEPAFHIIKTMNHHF